MAGDDSKRLRSERVILWQHCMRPSDGDASEQHAFVERSVARVRAGGGQALAALGPVMVASFDIIELVDAVDLARSLVEDESRGAFHVSIGIALGEVDELREVGGIVSYRGDVLDHAQTLAAKARSGEVVLDEAALTPALEHFLFAREISTPLVRGRALDPDNPRRDACRKALKRLKPAPIPQSSLPAFEALRQWALAPEQARIVVRSDDAVVPLELIDRLAAGATPTLRLRVGRTAGGLQPLGGLALALRRLWPEDSDLEGAGLPPALRARIKALLRGQAVQRAEMVTGLTELLAHYAGQGVRPWIVLDQLQDIDPATLGVIAETALAPGLDFVLFMTLLPEVNVPAALIVKAEVHEVAIPSLDLGDRRAVAETVLSLEESSEIGLRVALLGGETPLGVVEAARALVSAGDLVARGDSFAWRTVPRAGIASVPVEALITERALGLPSDAYRALEALCVAPPDAPREVFEAVAARDGLARAALDAGLQQLMDEGFVDDGLSLGSADVLVRGAVRNNMPPARAAELHRFVADVLHARLKAKGFGSAQLAYHLAEGGLEADAARSLIDAAHSAVQASFHRVGLRLLATAVELDGSAEIRRLASEIAREVEAATGGNERRSSRPPPPLPAPEAEPTPQAESEPPEDMAHAAIRLAREAMLERDFESMERWLDTAVAAGWEQRAAQRLLAISQLARGHAHEAMLTLSRGRATQTSEAAGAQDALCWALVHLEGGDPLRAVRDALGALSSCRRAGDARGERAALQVLSWCYAGSDRPDDASRIAAFGAGHGTA